MPRVEITHTADLSTAERDEARGLLEAVFAGEWDPTDWEHALGGLHVRAFDGAVLVGHASVVQRRLLHGGRALRAGYVEGVAVAEDRRGEGLGAAVMAEAERIAHAAYDLGALGTTELARGLYLARGWQPWRGPLCVLSPHGVERTRGEEGHVLVLPGAASVDLSGTLTCDWRDGDVW